MKIFFQQNYQPFHEYSNQHFLLRIQWKDYRYDKKTVLVTVKNQRYYAFCYEGKLNGIENAVILLTYPEKAFGNPKALRAFISTNVSLGTKEILDFYVKRWSIEVFFRRCKNTLALDSYQIRSSKGIQRYWLLMSLAYFICCTGVQGSTSFTDGYHTICTIIRQEKYSIFFNMPSQVVVLTNY